LAKILALLKVILRYFLHQKIGTSQVIIPIFYIGIDAFHFNAEIKIGVVKCISISGSGTGVIKKLSAHNANP
jgi:hypothetical protein